MDRLREMEIFVQTVESGSLSAAARALGLSVAVVSKEVARLEERLGARLLTRTSRRLSITPEGELFHANAVRLLSDVAEAEAEVRGSKDQIAGTLRITAPVAFGRRFVAPVLARLAQQNPLLRPHLNLTDALVNLVEENIDVAIRFGGAADASLVVRKIARNDRIVCASPAYLAANPAPQRPADLAAVPMLVIGQEPTRMYRFVGIDGQDETVRVSALLSSTNGDVVHDWALAGLGLEVKSVWDVADDLLSGRIVQVLSDWHVPGGDMYAIFPTRRHISHRSKVFVDELRRDLAGKTPNAFKS